MLILLSYEAAAVSFGLRQHIDDPERYMLSLLPKVLRPSQTETSQPSDKSFFKEGPC